LAVWAASLADGDAAPFHATATDLENDPVVEGLPAIAGASGAILLADPYSFPAEAVLSELAEAAPGVPVLGGLASARAPTGSLFVGDEVHDEGAVGVCLDEVEILPCISQGAAPVGRELTVTAAEGNIIHELAGRPALRTVERIVGELSHRERALVAGGLLIGIVIDPGKPEFEQGDFLVRGIIGADPESGSIAVGAAVHEGQVVRLHARDARSADEDLRRALRLQLEAMSGTTPAGSLLFSCNGRGRAMFGATNHDADAVYTELHGSPAAGFFAAGEIGPVGGRSFLHGFTATLAVFPG
jgi:small ligand-binding sensory domain FIST